MQCRRGGPSHVGWGKVVCKVGGRQVSCARDWRAVACVECGVSGVTGGARARKTKQHIHFPSFFRFKDLQRCHVNGAVSLCFATRVRSPCNVGQTRCFDHKRALSSCPATWRGRTVVDNSLQRAWHHDAVHTAWDGCRRVWPWVMSCRPAIDAFPISMRCNGTSSSTWGTSGTNRHGSSLRGVWQPCCWTARDVLRCPGH